jgi:hypothetical protein
MAAFDHLFNSHDVRSTCRKPDEILNSARGIIASVIALVFRIRLLTTTDTTFTQSALFICV